MLMNFVISPLFKEGNALSLIPFYSRSIDFTKIQLNFDYTS